eukprot:1503151-Rhodomonas_salina.7
MELITHPTILFLDEPTTGMHLRARYAMCGTNSAYGAARPGTLYAALRPDTERVWCCADITAYGATRPGLLHLSQRP